LTVSGRDRKEEAVSVILAKNWWSLVIRGLAAVTLGLITVIQSEVTLSTLVLVFFVYTLFDGLVGLAGALRAAEAHQRWRSLLMEGLAGIAAAIVTVAWPRITVFSLIYIIAVWALVTGVFEIAAALRLRRYVRREWLLALSGAASLILGVLMIGLPLAGPLPTARWLGSYALTFGALLIGLGFRLKAWAQTPVANVGNSRAINV